MISRFCTALALASLLLTSASAQTIRIDTNVGNIDFVLNPTNNPALVGHVDNILQYVNGDLYDSSVINRAAEGFVLQFGGFSLDSLIVPSSFDSFVDIPSFDPVVVDSDGDLNADFIPDSNNDMVVDNIDAAAVGLTNTIGTVSLALQSGNPNSGTSSFFVNLGDNSELLDPQAFVPFAEVPDMTTVDLIMALPQVPVPGGGLASQDFPTVNNASVVFIERAFVLEDEGPTSSVTFSELTTADAVAAIDAAAVATTSSLTSATDGTLSVSSTLVPGSDSGTPITFSTVTPGTTAAALATTDITAAPVTSSVVTPAAAQAIAVPEPPALVLAVGALMMIYVMKPSKTR